MAHHRRCTPEFAIGDRVALSMDRAGVVEEVGRIGYLIRLDDGTRVHEIDDMVFPPEHPGGAS